MASNNERFSLYFLIDNNKSGAFDGSAMTVCSRYHCRKSLVGACIPFVVRSGLIYGPNREGAVENIKKWMNEWKPGQVSKGGIYGTKPKYWHLGCFIRDCDPHDDDSVLCKYPPQDPPRSLEELVVLTPLINGNAFRNTDPASAFMSTLDWALGNNMDFQDGDPEDSHRTIYNDENNLPTAMHCLIQEGLEKRDDFWRYIYENAKNSDPSICFTSENVTQWKSNGVPVKDAPVQPNYKKPVPPAPPVKRKLEVPAEGTVTKHPRHNVNENMTMDAHFEKLEKTLYLDIRDDLREHLVQQLAEMRKIQESQYQDIMGILRQFVRSDEEQ